MCEIKINDAFISRSISQLDRRWRGLCDFNLNDSERCVLFITTNRFDKKRYKGWIIETIFKILPEKEFIEKPEQSHPITIKVFQKIIDQIIEEINGSDEQNKIIIKTERLIL